MLDYSMTGGYEVMLFYFSKSSSYLYVVRVTPVTSVSDMCNQFTEGRSVSLHFLSVHIINLGEHFYPLNIDLRTPLWGHFHVCLNAVSTNPE